MRSILATSSARSTSSASTSPSPRPAPPRPSPTWSTRLRGDEPLRDVQLLRVHPRRARRRHRGAGRASAHRRTGRRPRAGPEPSRHHRRRRAGAGGRSPPTFGIETFTFSEAALREGVLLDTIARFHAGATAPPARRVRRSIRAAGRALRRRPGALGARRRAWRCSCSTPLVPMHGLASDAREYLEAGALLANVGLVSPTASTTCTATT